MTGGHLDIKPLQRRLIRTAAQKEPALPSGGTGSFPPWATRLRSSARAERRGGDHAFIETHLAYRFRPTRAAFTELRASHRFAAPDIPVHPTAVP
jgi:hypothetical protein